MNQAEIANLFIRAAEIDRKLPDAGSPGKLKAQSLPFVHDSSGLADVRVCLS